MLIFRQEGREWRKIFWSNEGLPDIFFGEEKFLLVENSKEIILFAITLAFYEHSGVRKKWL